MESIEFTEFVVNLSGSTVVK